MLYRYIKKLEKNADSWYLLNGSNVNPRYTIYYSYRLIINGPGWLVMPDVNPVKVAEGGKEKL